MIFRSFIFHAVIICCCQAAFAQKNNRVIITADISTFQGKLPVTNLPEWQGDDTLVRVYRLGPDYTLGAEFLEIGQPGDALNPNQDSAKRPVLKKYKAEMSPTHYTWNIVTDQPLEISNRALLGEYYRAMPGDSINISYQDNDYHFSGRGALKYQVLNDIARIIRNEAEPVRWFDSTVSRFINTDEYLQLSRFYDNQVRMVLAILEANRLKLSKHDFERIKANGISRIEDRRFKAFCFIPRDEGTKAKKQFTYSTEDMIRIWDSTMYKPWARWLRSSPVQNIGGFGTTGYIETFIGYEILRKYGFRVNLLELNDATFKKMVYEREKNEYTGLFRERLLCKFIEEQITQEMGAWNWFVQSILKDYYATSRYPAYKGWMQVWEKKHQGGNKTGAPLFKATDTKGNVFAYKDIAGKFAVINFWYTGCQECKTLVPALTKMQNALKDNPNFAFVHVSVDKDKKLWQKSIDNGIYVPKGGIQLFTGGNGKKHDMVKDFNVSEYPTIRMIDSSCRIFINTSNPYSRINTEEELVAMVKERAYYFRDGPYVFHGNTTDTVYTILGSSLEKRENVNEVTVLTDQLKSFRVNIQPRPPVQPVEYAAPGKLFVLSDIEGDFAAFRKLLQANKIIDDEFNWTFGQGHLVFAGDMFDRGEHVTECLWLLYLLEQKAAAAGGYVHFILGNHDVFNLNGVDRYIDVKYKFSYRLLNKSLADVYNEQSTLGRWLRTKNIMEKIGDMLFTHGGISQYINNMPLTLEQMNTLARPYYDKLIKGRPGNIVEATNTDPNIKLLLTGYKSPLWNRQYYIDHFSGSENEFYPRVSVSRVDSTLQKFGVRRIVTGHTIVADTISVHFDGKVINTDTRHANGKSEALLIEDNRYYRVDAEGRRVLLFTDEKRK